MAYQPFPLNGAATGNITAVGQVVKLLLPSGTSATAFQLTGSFVGTVIFESSANNETTYNARVYRSAGILNNLQTGTSVFPSEWRGNSASMTHVQVRCTAFTSGSLVVAIASSGGAGAIFLNAAIPIGGQSIGNSYIGTLAAAASFVGVYENLENVASVSVNLSTSQAGTLQFEWSQDGTTLFVADTVMALAANTPRYVVLKPGRAQFVRATVVNTAGASSNVRLEIVYRSVAMDNPAVPLGVPADINDNMLPEITQAVMVGKGTAANIYNQVPVDAKTGMTVTNRPAVRAGQQKAFVASSSVIALAASGNLRALFSNPAGSGVNVIILAIVSENTSGGNAFGTLFRNPSAGLPTGTKTPFNAVLGGAASVATLSADSNLAVPMSGGISLTDIFIKGNDRVVFSFPFPLIMAPGVNIGINVPFTGAANALLAIYYYEE